MFYDVDWDETFARNPTGIGKVREIWGASSAVEIELWRYLLDIDLITTWKAEPRPVDEPVRRAMHDSRAYEAVHRLDEQWVRILDLDAALSARTYGPGRHSVSVRVHDPMFATNTGTWTISADGAERNDRPGRRRGRHRHAVGRLPRRRLVARPRGHRRARRRPTRYWSTLDTLFAVRPDPVLRHRLLTRPPCYTVR